MSIRDEIKDELRDIDFGTLEDAAMTALRTHGVSIGEKVGLKLVGLIARRLKKGRAKRTARRAKRRASR